MSAPERRCPQCDAVIVLKPGERRDRFDLRIYCSGRCARKAHPPMPVKRTLHRPGS